MSCAGKRMPRSEGRPGRRRRGLTALLVLGAAAICVCVSAPASARASERAPPTLVVATWGGTYETSQRAALFRPFTEATGIAVQTAPYAGGPLPRPGTMASWDVVDMLRADARSACDDNRLDPFDPDVLAPAPDGTPAADDFRSDAITACSVAHLVFSTVIAYDDRAFPGVKPRSIADFFDTDTFPGKRALRRAPVGLLEWALRSYGVPRQQIYDLLSTDRGLRLAFRRLDRLRPHLLWWQDGNDPVVLLKLGAVSMASGFNGRFFHAQVLEGVPISVIWDSQLLEYSTWAIPRDAPQKELARRFIRFVTRAEPMAALANRIAYGPTRVSAERRVGLHVVAGVPMDSYMPTAERHLAQAITKDDLWYANTEALRMRRFSAWLGQVGGLAESGQ